MKLNKAVALPPQITCFESGSAWYERDLLDPDPGGKKAEIKYVPDEKAQLEEQELNKQYKTLYCWCLIIEICQTFVKDLLEIF